ncbi:MAG: hypothetical protein JO197_11520 [Acidobacteria bacterium]|nr:hypothetical protein [Acidobacteriota bacterium]MBV9476105.1 hypothetical protein [Acidobacteriota bacterium]
MKPRFDAIALLDVLVTHRVRFIIIGGFAANLLGSPSVTMDLDICYDRSRDNLEALAAALKDLDATLRGAPAELPFIIDARTLAMGDSFTFNTREGALDCLGTPSGTNGYGDLVRHALPFGIEELRVLVASVDDVIRMKRAASRGKDLIEIDILTALKEERERQPPTSEF